MARLLFVGAGRGETKGYLVDGLHEQGYELVVLAEDPPDWIDEYAYRTVRVEFTEPGPATDVGRRYGVDGVFTCDEAYVELTAEVARRLGRPGLSAEAARLCRDKYAMRERLARAGIPSARSVKVDTRAEALAAAARLGYPVVLKPRNLGGSVGVVRADRPADVERLFAVATDASMARIRALPGLLVEEYLDGPELSVESVVSGGATTACGVTAKVLGFPPYFEEVGHFARPVDPARDGPLVALVREVHAALGITDGATHCELRMTATGPRVVEIGARLAGDRIPRLTRLATGIDLLGAAAAVAAGRPVAVRASVHRVAGIAMVYPPHDGIVTRLDAADGLDGAELGWYASLGQHVALPPRGFLSRLAYLIADGATRDEVTRRLDAARAALRIEVRRTAAVRP